MSVCTICSKGCTYDDERGIWVMVAPSCPSKHVTGVMDMKAKPARPVRIAPKSCLKDNHRWGEWETYDWDGDVKEVRTYEIGSTTKYTPNTETRQRRSCLDCGFMEDRLVVDRTVPIYQETKLDERRVERGSNK
jgi:hypothetical protein